MMTAEAHVTPRRAGILVVDDDDRVRRLCARSLRTQGYNVMEASGGWEAIELVAQHSREIDVVITDIVMPELDGIELVTRLRAAHPELAVILMSGYAPVELLRRGAFAETFPLLRKPFVIDQLCGKVREALGET
jgi:two-component system, cell cycle sensor histidine kinase and response regulator CckA